MYCSSCGVAVSQLLSYCNHCGAQLGPTRTDNLTVLSEAKPELLVGALVSVFIFGLVAIAILIGVLKQVAAFDLPILLAVTMLSFTMMLLVEGVLIWQLLNKRRVKNAIGIGPLKEQNTSELEEAPALRLPEPPLASVTEHTTRAFEPVYRHDKSQ